MYKDTNPDIMKGLRYMKRLWIIAIASAVLLTGCASNQAKTDGGAAAGGAPESDVNSVPAITEIALEEPAIAEGETQPPEKLTTPPEIRISTTTEMIASAAFMTKGTYSWSYEESDGMMASVEACCDIPSSFENVTAVFDPGELTRAPKIAVPVGAKIVKIECWNGTATQSVGFTEDGEVQFPVEPIGNTYCVTIEFDEGWGSYGEYGTCDYIFRTTDNVSDNAASDSGNSTESVPPVTAQSSAGFDPDEIVTHPGMIITDPMQKTPEPPELSLGVYSENSDEQLEVILSPNNTFTWSYIDDNGNASTICVDCPAPYQMDLEPDFDVVDVEKARVELTNDGKLTGVTNWSSEGEWLDVDFDEKGEIYFPESPIGDIYSVSVEYPEGNCTYVFAAYYEELWECGTGELEELYEVKPGGEPVMTPPCTIYRVHDFNDGRMYPEVIVIDSIEALKLYFGENNNTETGFELDSVEDEMFSKYDRRFFDENALIFVRIMEGSGSISHEFKGIDHDNNIIIQRNEPEIGTCDMAYYHIAIEIPKGMAGNDFGLVTNTVYEGDWLEELVPQQPDGIE